MFAWKKKKKGICGMLRGNIYFYCGVITTDSDLSLWKPHTDITARSGVDVLRFYS